MANKLDEIFNQLKDQPRLLLEAELKPLQGDRFQPTGFPDLGAATYKLADGTPMLLVESAQSMANRLEEVCWDKARNEIVEPLRGLPHIVKEVNGSKTSTIQEAHRLNSPYIIDDSLKRAIKQVVGDPDKGSLNIRGLAQVVFSHDVGSVIHGVFLEKIAGRLRLQRLLSSFIEARGVSTVASGGVKLDHINPSGKAAEGYGNVPFSRSEFTAANITAYFNLDLATLRGYALGEPAERLILSLSLYKILKLLTDGMRLRTACDLEAKTISITRPEGIILDFALLAEIEDEMQNLIAACFKEKID